MTRVYSWEELAGLTLRRQFPSIRGTGQSAIKETLRRIGPIQSQVARSPFVSIAARLPGARYADIVAVHESYDVVRGSNLRGTVHSCVRGQHPLLDSVTRRALAKDWRRALKLERVDVAEVQAAMEQFATGQWRTPEELRTYLVEWISGHETPASAAAASAPGVGRAMAHIHSGLIRRPAQGTAWERQTAPVYRVATDQVGEAASPKLADPDAALLELTRLHLTSYGPANRRDIAWWSGEGLRNVDVALASLGDELTQRPGPDGQTYYDLVELRNARHDPGLRLLPEFDAAVVGYDPKSRDRFFDAGHLQHFWIAANGAFTAVVLAGGRLVGSWNLAGKDSERRIEVRMFPGQTAVSPDDLAGPIKAVEQALAIDIHAVDVSETAA